jgi:hypothetical protein
VVYTGVLYMGSNSQMSTDIIYDTSSQWTTIASYYCMNCSVNNSFNYYNKGTSSSNKLTSVGAWKTIYSLEYEQYKTQFAVGGQVNMDYVSINENVSGF